MIYLWCCLLAALLQNSFNFSSMQGLFFFAVLLNFEIFSDRISCFHSTNISLSPEFMISSLMGCCGPGLSQTRHYGSKSLKLLSRIPFETRNIFFKFSKLFFVIKEKILNKYYHFAIELLEDEVLAIQTRIPEAWSFFTTDFSCTYGQRQWNF